MKNFQSDTQLTFWSRLPVMILSFLSVVLLTRLLGPEGNGLYTFLFAVLNLLLTVIGLQLESSVPFFLARHQEEKGKVLSSLLVIATLSLVGLVAFLFLVVFVFPQARSLVIPEGRPLIFFFGFLILVFFFAGFPH